MEHKKTKQTITIKIFFVWYDSGDFDCCKVDDAFWWDCKVDVCKVDDEDFGEIEFFVDAEDCKVGDGGLGEDEICTGVFGEEGKIFGDGWSDDAGAISRGELYLFEVVPFRLDLIPNGKVEVIVAVVFDDIWLVVVGVVDVVVDVFAVAMSLGYVLVFVGGIVFIIILFVVMFVVLEI